jgi:hypothetical protein
MLMSFLEYYDKDENLIYVLPMNSDPIDIKGGTIFDSLLAAACAASNPAGNYVGTNNIKYEKGVQAEQKIAILIQQNGSDLKVRFETPNGGQGEGTGTLKNNRVDTISLRSTAQGCPGSYDGSLSFVGNSISWTYKGNDCGGSMEGHGTATKVER